MQDALLGQFFAEKSVGLWEYLAKSLMTTWNSKLLFSLLSQEGGKNHFETRLLEIKAVIMLLRQSTQPRWRSRLGSIKSTAIYKHKNYLSIIVLCIYFSWMEFSSQ